MLEPYHGYPLSAQWGEQLLIAFEDKVDFYFGNEHIPFYLVDLRTDDKEEDGSVRIVFASDDLISVYKLVIGGEAAGKGYHYRLVNGVELSIQRGDSEPIPLPEYMVSDPVTILRRQLFFLQRTHYIR